jgi:hypothetical protein
MPPTTRNTYPLIAFYPLVYPVEGLFGAPRACKVDQVCLGRSGRHVWDQLGKPMQLPRLKGFYSVEQAELHHEWRVTGGTVGYVVEVDQTWGWLAMVRVTTMRRRTTMRRQTTMRRRRTHKHGLGWQHLEGHKTCSVIFDTIWTRWQGLGVWRLWLLDLGSNWN